MAAASGNYAVNNPVLGPDSDAPDNQGHEFAQFGSGCFWGAELRFQRVVGVVKTEVGYSQGHVDNPNYKLVCSGSTNHSEVVRVQFDPEVCAYMDLLSVFWDRHDPTTLNRQARLAEESKKAKQAELKDTEVVTEILPAKKFYRAEEYHQQYLEKGGRRGNKQSAEKGCTDPISCYG